MEVKKSWEQKTATSTRSLWAQEKSLNICKKWYYSVCAKMKVLVELTKSLDDQSIGCLKSRWDIRATVQTTRNKGQTSRHHRNYSRFHLEDPAGALAHNLKEGRARGIFPRAKSTADGTDMQQIQILDRRNILAQVSVNGSSQHSWEDGHSWWEGWDFTVPSSGSEVSTSFLHPFLQLNWLRAVGQSRW